ncbi:MAG: alpha/beta fold hydrolase [Parachlamydiales bacterium]|jgi:hypothetical protein
MSQELPFEPIPFIKGSFPQTVIGALPNIVRGPISHTKFILLSDKDHLALEVTTPKKWKKNDLTVVMVHGLCGSHNSPILIRLSKKLEAMNVRAIRLNLRGCGSGKGKARKMYHAGQSEDISEALEALHSETPDSPIVLIGFSLGGNIVLKLSAELSIRNLRLLKKVIAINPPVDLYSSIRLLAEPQNMFYEKFFIKLLKQDINFRYKIFPEFKKYVFPQKKFHFYDFDQIYTVKEYQFQNNIDFYKRSSSKFLIPAINFECKILFSEDDPIIKIQDFENFNMPDNVQLFTTKKGGHLGYLTMPGKAKSIYWVDNLILKWIFEK